MSHSQDAIKGSRCFRNSITLKVIMHTPKSYWLLLSCSCFQVCDTYPLIHSVTKCNEQLLYSIFSTQNYETTTENWGKFTAFSSISNILKPQQSCTFLKQESWPHLTAYRSPRTQECHSLFSFHTAPQETELPLLGTLRCWLKIIFLFPFPFSLSIYLSLFPLSLTCSCFLK